MYLVGEFVVKQAPPFWCIFQWRMEQSMTRKNGLSQPKWGRKGWF